MGLTAREKQRGRECKINAYGMDYGTRGRITSKMGGGMNYMIEKEIVEEKLKEFEEAQARQLPNNYSSSGSNLGGSD